MTRKSLLGVEQDKSMLNFGYVSIGESLTLKQKIWNCDNEQMRIKCSILLDENVEQEEECFKVFLKIILFALADRLKLNFFKDNQCIDTNNATR